VYSTCSLEVEENENQISWFLNQYPDMELAPQNPCIGQEIKFENKKFGVQMFDPRIFCGKPEKATETDGKFCDHLLVMPSEGMNADFLYDQDTIGFFVAKMVKL